jgi:hypothetical protein
VAAAVEAIVSALVPFRSGVFHPKKWPRDIAVCCEKRKSTCAAMSLHDRFMARGSGNRDGATSTLARPRGPRTLPTIRQLLTDLEHVHGDLRRLPAEARRSAICASGLLDLSAAAALIGEALADGALPDRAYGEFLHGGRGDAYLVESLLTFTSAKRGSISDALRACVFASDHNRCCMESSFCAGPLHADHFVPVLLGGESSEANLWTLCQTHNLWKRESWPSAADAAAWLASGRALPEVYLDKLAERPWREGFVADPAARGARSVTRERRGPVRRVRVPWTRPPGPLAPAAPLAFR